MGEELMRRLFWLAVLLIAVAYFAGLTTDIATAGDVVNKIGLTFTGRDANGKFANYPGAAA